MIYDKWQKGNDENWDARTRAEWQVVQECEGRIRHRMGLKGNGEKEKIEKNMRFILAHTKSSEWSSSAYSSGNRLVKSLQQ